MDISNYKFFEMQAYGFNEIIKTYCDFSKFLPLPAHVEHGWTALTNSLPSDLKVANGKGLMLVLSQRRKKEWVSSSKIPCEIVGAPFIHYRLNQNIKKSNTAQGTVFFPAHSTKNVGPNYDIQKLISELNSLPDEYKPITICMHPEDYDGQLKKYFEKNNFFITSAGDKKSKGLDFVKIFYSILAKHKYAASNEIGSHSFYAIEMDIPFFLIGEAPVWNNKNKKDENVPEHYTTSTFKTGEKARQLFETGPQDYITIEQKNFVYLELGIKDALSPSEMKKVLVKNFNNHPTYYLTIPLYTLYRLAKKII